MNTRRLVVLLLAAGAAGVVALMVRGFVGGGTKPAEARVAPAPVEIARVLVAATRLDPGKIVTPDQVRWQAWPVKSIMRCCFRFRVLRVPGTCPRCQRIC